MPVRRSDNHRSHSDLHAPASQWAVCSTPRLLIEGLGEWAEVSPKVLDLNEKAARPGRRGWHRNAWPKRGRHDSDPPWWGFMFDDDEE